VDDIVLVCESMKSLLQPAAIYTWLQLRYLCCVRAVCLTTLPAAQSISWRAMAAGKECIAEDSEGSDCGIIEATSRRFF
jgi:hypothetical protein